MHEGLTKYQEWEMTEGTEDLFDFRLLIEDARARLREEIVKLDEELIRRMKEQGIKEFRTGPEGARKVIRYGKQKKDKITDLAKMSHFLFAGSDAEKDLARHAFSGAQSSWKMPKVKELADTLGVKGLVQTTWTDKVEVKAIPEDRIKG